MRTKRTKYLSDLHIANMANVARRHCRIGKVTPKSVVMASRAFRDAFVKALAERGPPDEREVRFWGRP